MRTTILIRCLAGLALAFLITGCESSFTGQVWERDSFRHVREPAAHPQVAIFYETRHKDFLVSYDSVRDGGNDPRRLNYFLGENSVRDPGMKKPVFVSTNGLTLIVVPLNQETNTFPQAAFHTQLIIQTAETTIGPTDLPACVEASGLAARIALTPAAALGDAACFSLIVGVLSAGAFSPH